MCTSIFRYEFYSQLQGGSIRGAQIRVSMMKNGHDVAACVADGIGAANSAICKVMVELKRDDTFGIKLLDFENTPNDRYCFFEGRLLCKSRVYS